MLSQSTSAAVDVLGALGVSLTQLGDMVSMAPFSSVLKAFGALCTACRNAEENKENVARVQKRAALLLPALALIHQRLKVISDADVRTSVEKLVDAIVAQLDAQVRSRVLQAWVENTWPSMVPPPPRQHSPESGCADWIGWSVQCWLSRRHGMDASLSDVLAVTVRVSRGTAPTGVRPAVWMGWGAARCLWCVVD